jgi:hypothetical protein
MTENNGFQPRPLLPTAAPGTPLAEMLARVAATGKKRPWLPVNTGAGSTPRTDDPPERRTGAN